MLRRVSQSLLAFTLSLALVVFGVYPGVTSEAFAAGLTEQSINPGALPSVAHVNESFSMSPTATSGLPVEISVEGSPANVCNSTSSSYFFVEAIGTCVITFDQPGDSTFAPAPTVSVSITVEGAQQVITAAPALYVKIGETGQITANSSAGLPLQYMVISSGAPNCSVTSRGLVTGLSVGPCVVRLDARSTSTINAALSVNQSVWVIALPDPPVVSGAPPVVTPVVPVTPITPVTPISPSTPVTPVLPTDSGDIVFVLDQEATTKLKPSLDARDVRAATGGLMVFKGRNLLSIEKVFVGENIPVKILMSSDAEMQLELPKASLFGLQTILLKTSGGQRFYQDAVNYLTAPAAQTSVTKILKGFKANQTVLTKSQKAALMGFVKSVGKYKLVECRGLTKPIYLVCKYLKTIYKAGRVKVTRLKLMSSSPASKQVRIVFTK